jgi:predicted Zn-dependent peptidase
VLIDRPGSVQTVLQLGTLGIERNSADYFSLLLADKILGGGPAARLFLNLREDKGYTYGAYSNFGAVRVSEAPGLRGSEVRTDVTDGAMKEFLFELKRLRDEKVSVEELENAKRGIVGSFALSLEQPARACCKTSSLKSYTTCRRITGTLIRRRVAAITVADIQNVAQKYIDLGPPSSCCGG